MTVGEAKKALEGIPDSAEFVYSEIYGNGQSLGGGMFDVVGLKYVSPRNEEDPFYLCGGFVDVEIRGLNVP